MVWDISDVWKRRMGIKIQDNLKDKFLKIYIYRVVNYKKSLKLT